MHRTWGLKRVDKFWWFSLPTWMIWKFCSRPEYSVNPTASTVTTSYLMNDIETLIHESPANDLLILGVCGWVNCLLVANDIRPLISPLQIIWRYSEDYDVFERKGHFHAPLISIWSKHQTFGRFHVTLQWAIYNLSERNEWVFLSRKPPYDAAKWYLGFLSHLVASGR